MTIHGGVGGGAGAGTGALHHAASAHPAIGGFGGNHTPHGHPGLQHQVSSAGHSLMLRANAGKGAAKVTTSARRTSGE